jgi:Dolichyl-phosphate-mannose-protein mannosyltransferase
VNNRIWYTLLTLILLIALCLRLQGIHNPLLDHPGWRQGDTAAIARNFATIEYNPLRPQTDYDGPPPNYVELELQIVPFLAATLYKVFGIHEIFGRLISIAFSLGTVLVLAYFGRLLSASRARCPEIAGLAAAFLFAIYPGSVYYGRTFMPDTTMVFFFTAALYATTRWALDERKQSWGVGFCLAAALMATALLAKPVAIVALIPALVVMGHRWGLPGTLTRPQGYIFLACALAPLAAYDRYISSIAEWHWASGITRLHVLPSLITALHSWDAMHVKLRIFREVLAFLPGTMLGPYCTAIFALSIFCIPCRSRSHPLLFSWLAGCLAYAFVIMTYERVDYYFYIILPLAALWSGMFIERLTAHIPSVSIALALLIVNHAPIQPYYHYNPSVYRAAKALDATLAPNALIVMGHYDPSILYYINRKGWEEDPYLWTPFDEQSAIRKGARYYIAIENKRLQRNVELYAWLQRFPVMNPNAKWQVYETDYAKMLPGAEARWRAFRIREKNGSL